MLPMPDTTKHSKSPICKWFISTPFLVLFSGVPQQRRLEYRQTWIRRTVAGPSRVLQTNLDSRTYRSTVYRYREIHAKSWQFCVLLQLSKYLHVNGLIFEALQLPNRGVGLDTHAWVTPYGSTSSASFGHIGHIGFFETMRNGFTMKSNGIIVSEWTISPLWIN